MNWEDWILARMRLLVGGRMMQMKARSMAAAAVGVARWVRLHRNHRPQTRWSSVAVVARMSPLQLRGVKLVKREAKVETSHWRRL